MKVKILAPAGTQEAKIAQMRAFEAEVQLVPGPRQACQDEAIRQSDERFYASHNWQAFFLQGTKLLAYELWEDFGFTAPDNIVIPLGAGSNVLGCHIGFSELLRSGAVSRMPRLFGVQPANCAPVDAALNAGADDWIDVEVQPTIAEGTAIRRPVRTREVLAAIRASGGSTVTNSEAEIADAVRKLARRGMFAEPTSANAAAAVSKLVDAGKIARGERTVVILTGTGIKSAGAMASIFGA
jgi:threonine synthase